MLVPHLHFNGNCLEALKFYEKAFKATITVCIKDETNNRIVHSEMEIFDNRIMLNDDDELDSCSNKSPIHLLVTFNSPSSLQETYQLMGDGCSIIQPMQKTGYSECIVDFIDIYGIRWGFMAE